MRTTLRTQETANGPAYIARTGPGTHTIVFPYGTGPFLAWNGATIPIANPTRFGPYGTPAERAAYTLAFINATAN